MNGQSCHKYTLHVGLMNEIYLLSLVKENGYEVQKHRYLSRLNQAEMTHEDVCKFPLDDSKCVIVLVFISGPSVSCVQMRKSKVNTKFKSKY